MVAFSTKTGIPPPKIHNIIGQLSKYLYHKQPEIGTALMFWQFEIQG
jgi:hypothetical protein